MCSNTNTHYHIYAQHAVVTKHLSHGKLYRDSVCVARFSAQSRLGLQRWWRRGLAAGIIHEQQLLSCYFRVHERMHLWTDDELPM